MSKVAIVYWSGTGNTEAMANLVAEGAKAAGAEADVLTASEFDKSKIASYDNFAFGCPAMGAEELEEMEFAPMYDDVEPELGGRNVVLFGSYDWAEGEWMELWEERAKGAGLEVLDTVIAKDYPDDDAKEACKKLGERIAAA